MNNILIIHTSRSIQVMCGFQYVYATMIDQSNMALKPESDWVLVYCLARAISRCAPHVLSAFSLGTGANFVRPRKKSYERKNRGSVAKLSAETDRD